PRFEPLQLIALCTSTPLILKSQYKVLIKGVSELLNNTLHPLSDSFLGWSGKKWSRVWVSNMSIVGGLLPRWQKSTLHYIETFSSNLAPLQKLRLQTGEKVV
ncbi:MAG TPA: hypothetical protein VEL11_02460, partial [Candidatus Bathyarchaeia archaeon]|nr:hypothetical protein [Candidatus Bathyarchaeia archaeon]